MKKLITTNNGGMPIVLDDLRFLESSYTEIINAIVAHDNTNPVIISGCKYDKEQLEDTNNLVMTAGYIYFAGEIYAVDAVNSALVGSESFYWNITTSYDPAGSKTFQNSAVHNTYQIKKAEVLKSDPIPTGKTAFSATKDIFEVYREGISDNDTTDPMDTYINNFVSYINNPFLAKKGVSGQVVLSGLIENTSGISSADKVIGTLKNELRPSNPVYTKVIVLSNALTYLDESMVVIEPSGQVKFISQLSASYTAPKVVMNCTYLK